ncbi:hypothetical protein ACFZC5_35980 [Nocardia gamkensis]|uniref:hypothetical protein n=1 Tax=Nocardia gamkensis TaxID=352869 RepID=UPI0036ED5C39
MTHDEVGELLASDAPLREPMLGTMLCETAARAKEIMALDVEDLDTVNRCTTVVRKGGARDVTYWQTATARLLLRLIAGRKPSRCFSPIAERSVCGAGGSRPDRAAVRGSPTGGRRRCSKSTLQRCSAARSRCIS